MAHLALAIGLVVSVCSVIACSSSSGSATPVTDGSGVDAGDRGGALPAPSPTSSGEVDASLDAKSPPADASLPPKDLATTDGTVATGWYCGKNPALMTHVATWNAPTLKNDNNLFYVDKTKSTVAVVGYCTRGCSVDANAHAAHDECVAPDGAPIAGKECFGGAGKYCGHVLGIQARSYPVVPNADKEGLFSCDATAGVLPDANCDCQVTPGGADACVPQGGGRKLWIAYEPGAACVSDLTDFFHCMLEHTNMEDLALSYGTGYRVSFGAILAVPASCGTDYQCAVDAAHFPVGDLDVVLIVKSGGVGGQNNWDPVVTVGNKRVHIHGAFIGDASGNCGMQTAYAMHEVFEATSDPGSADCCDGEVPYTPQGASGCLAWNSGASIACAKWGPASCGGDNSYGLARIDCGGGKTFLYQRVSPANDEYGFHGATCLPIQVTH